MSDLLEFLLARLDEDEQVARDVPRELDSGEWPFWRDVDDESGATATDAYRDRFPPARALRDVDAKRQLLNAHYDYGGVCPRCFDSRNKSLQREEWPCEVAFLIALSYTDHPEFREEWRP